MSQLPDGFPAASGRFSRREMLQLGAGAAACYASVGAAEAAPPEVPPAIAALQPMVDGLEPIAPGEHRQRLQKAQRLMAQARLDALVVASGSSLTYLTGAEWGRSERFMGMVLTREGDPAWVVPAFERDRALEQIRIGGDVRPWDEHESPYALLVRILADRRIAAGTIGVEETMPYAFSDGIAAAAPASRLQSAVPVVSGCRMVKDAHELQLMKRACEITVQAHRAVFASLRDGMTQSEVARMSADAHRRLGIPGGSLVLFGADTAYPHGTTQARPLRAGDFVLIDGGGELHGYQSDITRTGVFGAAPTERQRTLWNVVRKAQDAAFRLARPGVACQALDAAARDVIASAGFGSGYQALTHRLGHGIGMEGHEQPYIVKGNDTPLQPGMCFSIEPGIYIRGEAGVRHEDIVCITADGASSLTQWPGTPESPAV